MGLTGWLNNSLTFFLMPTMKTYTMATTVMLPDVTAEQSMLGFAIYKGYRPTLTE